MAQSSRNSQHQHSKDLNRYKNELRLPLTKQEDPDSKMLPQNILDKNMNSAEGRPLDGYHHLKNFISPTRTKD